MIDTLLFLGDRFESRVEWSDDQHLIMNLPLDADWAEGAPVFLTFPERHVSVWPS